MKVSVIVPIYYGKKYIQELVCQAEKNAKKISCELELLLVNDAPDAPITEKIDSDFIQIRLINTDINRGIHGARIKGLEHARGTYILFLDQDDRITENYINSQLNIIGDADASVCRLIHADRVYYNRRMPFEKTINKEYMISKGNSIVSPGQVLLRKESIPALWRTCNLRFNGADDWLLWICMFNEKKSFVFNDEILFEHVVEGQNASCNSLEMVRSEQEVVKILKANYVLPKNELCLLKKTVKEDIYRRIQSADKNRKMLSLYDQWIRLQNQGVTCLQFLKKKRYRTVAIYGFGIIGKQLQVLLQGSELLVEYYIDRDTFYYMKNIPVYDLEDTLPKVDVILVSLVEHEDDIKKMLYSKTKADIWTINEIIKELTEEHLLKTEDVTL